MNRRACRSRARGRARSNRYPEGKLPFRRDSGFQEVVAKGAAKAATRQNRANLSGESRFQLVAPLLSWSGGLPIVGPVADPAIQFLLQQGHEAITIRAGQFAFQFLEREANQIVVVQAGVAWVGGELKP